MRSNILPARCVLSKFSHTGVLTSTRMNVSSPYRLPTFQCTTEQQTPRNMKLEHCCEHIRLSQHMAESCIRPRRDNRRSYRCRNVLYSPACFLFLLPTLPQSFGSSWRRATRFPDFSASNPSHTSSSVGMGFFFARRFSMPFRFKIVFNVAVLKSNAQASRTCA